MYGDQLDNSVHMFSSYIRAALDGTCFGVTNSKNSCGSKNGNGMMLSYCFRNATVSDSPSFGLQLSPNQKPFDSNKTFLHLLLRGTTYRLQLLGTNQAISIFVWSYCESSYVRECRLHKNVVWVLSVADFNQCAS